MTRLLKCDGCGVTEPVEIADWPSAIGDNHYCPECHEARAEMPGGDPVKTYYGWEQH